MKTKITAFTILTSLMISLLIPSFSAPVYAQSMMTQDISTDDIDNWDAVEEEIDIYDPWESYNRFMFKVNDKIYQHVFTPVSKGYDFMVHKQVQKRINKVFTNVRAPIRIFNNVFQGKWAYGTIELGRFIVNSSIGLGGIFDPGEAYFNLKPHAEDFGQTLGYHGMKSGRYIVWPILGPSTTRDTIGLIGDTALNPLLWLSVYEAVKPEETLLYVQALQRVNEYAYQVRDNYDGIIDRAVDPYVSVQHAYLQHRLKKINK